MSFKTNPILNRLKTRKGWKQSIFPQKSSNYSRDITLVLKVYLLLKAYLVLNNFKLLMCQVKNAIQFPKIIYIAIVYSKPKGKTRRKTLKSHFLSFSPTQYLPANKRAIHLIYNKLTLLQQFTTYLHCITLKKNPSKFWWKKALSANWLSHLTYIQKLNSQMNQQTRNSTLKLQTNRIQIYTNKVRVNNRYKKPHLNIMLRSKLFSKLHYLERGFFFLTKNINIINNLTRDLHNVKIKTDRYFVLLAVLKQKLRVNLFSLKKTLTIFFWLKNFYTFSKKNNRNLRKKSFSEYRNIRFYWLHRDQILNSRVRMLIKQFIYFRANHKKNYFSSFYRVFENKFSSFIKTHKRKEFIVYDQKYLFSLLQLYLYTIKVNNTLKFRLTEKSILWRNQVSQKYIFLIKLFNYFLYRYYNFSPLTTFHFKDNKFRPQFKNLLLSNFSGSQQRNKRSRSIIPNFKLYVFMRKLWKRKTNLWTFRMKDSFFIPSKQILLRVIRWKKYDFSQQKTQKVIKKSRRVKKLFFSFENRNYFSKKVSSSFSNLHHLKKVQKTETKSQNYSSQNSLQYRIPYWKENKKHSSLLNKYKLKSLLQNFLKLYLHTTFQIKIVNSVSEFKNLKFYRLFFTKPKRQNSSEKSLKKQRPRILTHITQKDFLPKFEPQLKSNPVKYIYLGFKKDAALNFKSQKILKQKDLTFQTINKDRSIKEIYNNFYWNQFLLLNYRKKISSYRNYSSLYNTLWEDQKKQLKVTPNIQYHEIKFIKRILPILAIFTRYLDVQLLVNYIAHELESTKQHWFVLSNLKNVLSFFPFHRLIAYKISIFGRINSAKKARMICLKKGNFSVQTFNRQINFGMAQSRARIGTFGVKMWIYY